MRKTARIPLAFLLCLGFARSASAEKRQPYAADEHIFLQKKHVDCARRQLLGHVFDELH